MSKDVQPMNKQAEDRLLGAVKEAVAWVEDGTDPTEAVIKTARDLDLNPEMTTLLVRAYNTGRMTYQREKCGGDVLCKMAEFPIARLEDVLGALWPPEPPSPTKRASVDLSCYDRPPSIEPRKEVRLREKAASVKIPAISQPEPREGDESIKMGKAWGEIQRLRRQVDDARYRAKEARDRYLAAMGKLADYFKEASLFREPFDEVEYHAQLLFGEPAKHALDYVYLRNGMKEKRAGAQPPLARPIDPDQAPYSLIREAIACGKEVLAHQREHRRIEKQAQQKFEETLRPFAPSRDRSPDPCPSSRRKSGSFLDDPPCFDKEGGLLGNILTGSTVAAVSGAARGAKPKSSDDLLQDAMIDLSDPQHENELRKIEAQTMLQDLLTNDEVLSSYDPDEVLQAYNEIVSLSPRIATQPAVIRPMLRKRLTQGAYEPFEAQQLADIEKAVASSEPSGGSAIPSSPARVLHGSSILS